MIKLSRELLNFIERGSVMAFNCPHCNELMYPNDDGTCPKCSKMARNSKPIKEEPSYILVKHEQWLPRICCICGNDADSYAKIKVDKKLNDKKFISKILVTIISFLFLPVKIFFSSYKDNSVYYKIESRMPICRACKKVSKIEPRFVDFEENHMAFDVHYKLREEFKKMGKYINYRDVK
jgi:NAD-dependent SIR2 family protein deacetylase